MNWLINTLWTSIGKKIMMAITGLGFCVFLVAHLAGNLTLYAGKDAFNSYSEHLNSLGALLTVAELGLLFFAIVHITTGTILFYQNFKARPIRYSVNRNAGGRTFGSAAMPYTGFAMLLFIIFHLMDFRFADKTNTTIFHIVSSSFVRPEYVILYTVAMIVAAVHVSHGFWSAFQTIGSNHPKYMPFIKGVSLVFSLIVGFGFGFIPIYISMLT